MREGRPELIGKFGPLARRWKGNDASYAAKHMWIHKHYGKANHCENDLSHTASRYEWANISDEVCKACDGSGRPYKLGASAPGTYIVRCASCNGTGRVSKG